MSIIPTPVHTRYAIDTLKDDHPVQFSLFVRSLKKVQSHSESHKTSYGWFQYAGIHGLPNIQWADDQTPINPDQTFFGYCTHGGALFPLWHRIYLWQLEKAIIFEAKKYINEEIYDAAVKATWLSEADKLRFPYWDWASNNGQMPTCVNEASVSIAAPTMPESTELFENPLIGYRFQNNESGPMPEDRKPGPAPNGWFKEPYASEWPKTARCPDANGNSRPDVANSMLGSRYKARRIGVDGINLKEYVFILLMSITEYIPFSTTGFYDNQDPQPPPAINYASLEDVHNMVHLFVGGYINFVPDIPEGREGHMALNEYAAFDPIFWLHHANCDRLFALWQAKNPGASFDTGFPSAGSAVTSSGTIETAATGLIPFQNPTTGSYWTSETIQHLEGIYELGYNYPELPGQPPHDPAAFADVVTNTIKELYGPPRSELHDLLPVSHDMRDVSHIERHEWQAVSRIERHAIDGSFMIHFYLGDVPRDPLNFVIPSSGTTSSYVGSNATFASKVADCPQCERQRDIKHLVTGATSLTRALLGDGVNVNDIEAVQAQLKERLHWRVQKANGEEVPLESVPSLMVAVTSTPTTVTKDNGIPEWHHNRSMIYPGVTKDRKGGLKHKNKYWHAAAQEEEEEEE